MTNENYSSEELERMLNMYNAKTSTDVIAETLSRSKRSVIAKLVQLGVYKKDATTKEKRKTRAELVADLESFCNLGSGQFEGLEKAPHTTLLLLHTEVSRLAQ